MSHSKRLRKKSSFLLESNEMPNEDGRFATGFVRHFLFLIYILPNAVLRISCLINEQGGLQAKCRFLKSDRKRRSKAAFINEEAHDNNALPEFLKVCKETRSFKDVMNCLFFCPYDTRIRTYVL